MKNNNTNLKSMLLISSVWQMKKTFKMIPISKDCPYIECIFDPESKMLAVVLDKIKETYHMLPKLDDNGDPVSIKGRARPGGQKTKEERRLVATYGEVYIADPTDQEQLIELFAINSDVFDYKTIMTDEFKGAIHQSMPKAEGDCPDCDKKEAKTVKLTT